MRFFGKKYSLSYRWQLYVFAFSVWDLYFTYPLQTPKLQALSKTWVRSYVSQWSRNWVSPMEIFTALGQVMNSWAQGTPSKRVFGYFYAFYLLGCLYWPIWMLGGVKQVKRNLADIQSWSHFTLSFTILTQSFNPFTERCLLMLSKRHCKISRDSKKQLIQKKNISKFRLNSLVDLLNSQES